MIEFVLEKMNRFLWRAARRGRAKVGPRDGTLLFHHSPYFRGFSWFAAFGIPLVITGFVVFFPKPKNFEPPYSLYILFAALGLPLWWEATWYALSLSREGLDCRSPWRGRQCILWHEVEGISYSRMNAWFVIHARGERKIRVPAFISGISQLLAECEQHLSPASLEMAKAGYVQVGRPFPDHDSATNA